MKYGVVIVNWKGADDTVACLDSLAAAAGRAWPIVVDNGSADGSLPRLAAVLGDRFGDRSRLVDAGENLGFAAGCNLGLRSAVEAGLDTVVFLNNDTVVEGAALDVLVDRLHEARDGATPWATLPMLVVDATDRIWNCGGTISRLGFRRYHLAGQPRAAGEARGELDCSFFTGCCFAVRSADFAARGGFSERFFFGEEDFELGLWMKNRGLRAVCVTSAVVRHKVSASFDAAAAGRAAVKAFVYYLNRFIHMRLRLGNALWALWVAAYLPYVAAALLGNRVLRARQLPRFVGRLVGRASRMRGVDRADFEALMREGFA